MLRLPDLVLRLAVHVGLAGASRIDSPSTPPDWHPAGLSDRTTRPGMVPQRRATGGRSATVGTRSGPPKVVFWLMVGLTLAALVAFAADMNAPYRLPAESWHDRTVEANVALVTRYYEEVWNRGRFTRVASFVAVDHAYHDATNPDIPPGVPGVVGVVAAHRAAFPDAVISLEDPVAHGDKVAVRFTERATHRGEVLGAAPTGNAVTVTGIAVFRIEYGLIAETWVNWDAYGLTRQVGLYLVPADHDSDWGPPPTPGLPGEPH